jgi:hypothetical protein
MKKVIYHRRVQKRLKGFSLIVVLIIALIGMAFIGVVLSTFELFSSASRNEWRAEDVYNELSREVEKAKATLKQEMIASTEPFKMDTSIATITSLDQLIIVHPATGEHVGERNDVPVSVGGKRALIQVRLYTMEYDLNIVPDTILKELPPVMRLKAQGAGGSSGPKGEDSGPPGPRGTSTHASNSGIYLIKATMNILDTNETFSIETSITQNIG